MARRYLKTPDVDFSLANSSFPATKDNLSAPAMKLANSRHARLVRWLSAALILVILWQWGNAGWIMAKAQVAQWLIARAWEERVGQDSQRVKPWPWADTYPIARLQIDSHRIDLFILEGAQGNSLAFGPGHLQGTAAPGEGVSVIGGHRDTHFRFLKDLVPGDDLQLQIPSGRRLYYRIEDIKVVDSRYVPLILEDVASPAPVSSLVLITCYPFNAIDPGGPLRLVVRARELREDSAINKASIEARELKARGRIEQTISSSVHSSTLHRGQQQELFRL